MSIRTWKNEKGEDGTSESEETTLNSSSNTRELSFHPSESEDDETSLNSSSNTRELSFHPSESEDEVISFICPLCKKVKCVATNKELQDRKCKGCHITLCCRDCFPGRNYCIKCMK
jgi:hypothetical protein